jgi:cellobiose epimerase
VQRGGFFTSGPLGRRADRLDKVYRVQAEALGGLLRMWRATGEREYLECLAGTLAWIDSEQVARPGGDWRTIVTPRGRTAGDMAGAWKGPYHQARALLEVSTLGAASPRPAASAV